MHEAKCGSTCCELLHVVVCTFCGVDCWDSPCSSLSCRQKCCTFTVQLFTGSSTRLHICGVLVGVLESLLGRRVERALIVLLDNMLSFGCGRKITQQVACSVLFSALMHPHRSIPLRTCCGLQLLACLQGSSARERGAGCPCFPVALLLFAPP